MVDRTFSKHGSHRDGPVVMRPQSRHGLRIVVIVIVVVVDGE